VAGAPGGDYYLSRAIVDGRGAPTVDTAFMGLTSCRWITIAKTLARRRRFAQPAACRLPVAVERAAEFVMIHQRITLPKVRSRDGTLVLAQDRLSGMAWVLR
jgi:hypothetical protein